MKRESYEQYKNSDKKQGCITLSTNKYRKIQTKVGNKHFKICKSLGAKE